MGGGQSFRKLSSSNQGTLTKTLVINRVFLFFKGLHK